jgi:hypothetical protein
MASRTSLAGAHRRNARVASPSPPTGRRSARNGARATCSGRGPAPHRGEPPQAEQGQFQAVFGATVEDKAGGVLRSILQEIRRKEIAPWPNRSTWYPLDGGGGPGPAGPQPGTDAGTAYEVGGVAAAFGGAAGAGTVFDVCRWDSGGSG